LAACINSWELFFVAYVTAMFFSPWVRSWIRDVRPVSIGDFVRYLLAAGVSTTFLQRIASIMSRWLSPAGEGSVPTTGAPAMNPLSVTTMLSDNLVVFVIVGIVFGIGMLISRRRVDARFFFWTTASMAFTGPLGVFSGSGLLILLSLVGAILAIRLLQPAVDEWIPSVRRRPQFFLEGATLAQLLLLVRLADVGAVLPTTDSPSAPNEVKKSISASSPQDTGKPRPAMLG
jgi:hypothetical protein